MDAVHWFLLLHWCGLLMMTPLAEVGWYITMDRDDARMTASLKLLPSVIARVLIWLIKKSSSRELGDHSSIVEK